MPGAEGEDQESHDDTIDVPALHEEMCRVEKACDHEQQRGLPPSHANLLSECRKRTPDASEVHDQPEVTRLLERESLVRQANQQRELVLQEVLSKADAESGPLVEQEFYELCIEESDDPFRPGFIVKQTLAQWSEIDGQVMWEEPEWERWPTLKKAEERSEEWKKALAAKGFTQSDLDF